MEENELSKSGLTANSISDYNATVRSPVEDQQITIDGIRWHYQSTGSGPALLLMHGLLGYSFSWRNAMPVWGNHSHVLAVDLPGAGFSEYPPGLDCSLRASAERILRFMDSVGIDSCDLLGTSHGGGVAMFAAALAPSRVRRLILVAPVNPWSGRGTFLSIFLSHPPIAPAFSKFAPGLSILHEFYFRRLFGDPSRIRPGTLEGYMEPLRRRGAFDYGLRILRSWNHDLRELRLMLHKIADIPALLVWGSLDGAVYPASAARLAQEFRNVQLVMLEGVGHLPYEEEPEEFNRTVEAFLMKR